VPPLGANYSRCGQQTVPLKSIVLLPVAQFKGHMGDVMQGWEL